MKNAEDLHFKAKHEPSRHTQKSNPWQAWTFVAVSALVITNAGWYYRWKVRAIEHAETLANTRTHREPQERVIYEYRQANPTTYSADQQGRTQATRNLVNGEECLSGIIIRRGKEGIESTGERCREYR